MKSDWEAKCYATPFDKGGKVYTGDGEPILTIMKVEGWLRKHGIPGAYADIYFTPEGKRHYTLTKQEDGTVEIFNLSAVKWPVYGVIRDGEDYFNDDDESDFVDIQDEDKAGDESKKDDDANKMRLDEIEDDEEEDDAGDEIQDEDDDAGDDDQEDDEDGDDEKPDKDNSEDGDEDGEDEEPVIRRLFARMYDGRRWRKQAVGDWELPRQISKVEFGLIDEEVAEFEDNDFHPDARQKQARVTFKREPQAKTSTLVIELPEGVELVREEGILGLRWTAEISTDAERNLKGKA